MAQQSDVFRNFVFEMNNALQLKSSCYVCLVPKPFNQNLIKRIVHHMAPVELYVNIQQTL
ncbi:hypothetical protein CGT81_16390 [Vibrio cholerae]|nr:hypothetical protein CGT81_16390 [Vibrio cholerae]